MKPTHRLGALACTILLGVTSAPGAAWAGAMYDGLANLTLTLTSVNGGLSIPSGVSVEYWTGVFDRHTATEGDAIAEALETLVPGDTPVAMNIGDQLIQVSHSHGQASDFGGHADSSMQTDGTVSIVNNSSGSVTVRLSYVFSAETRAFIDRAGLDAGAESGWSLGDDLGTVYIDDAVFADAIVGPNRTSLYLSAFFDLILDPAQARTLYSAVDADGFAEAPVPPVWTLLGAGFALCAVMRTKKRQRLMS